MTPPQKILLLAAFWYLVIGSYYSYLIHSNFMLTPVLATLSFLGIVTGISLTKLRRTADYYFIKPIPHNTSFNIAVFANILILLTFLSYLFVDPTYFSSDKLERAETVSVLFKFRFISFTACALLAVLVIRWRSCTPEIKTLILLAYALIFLYAVIELNRELFLVLVMSYYIYIIFNVKNISMSKLILYSFLIVPLFLVFKFAAYWLFFGKIYDGGLLSIGELVNWARWTDMALLSNLDLQYVQKNDVSYFLTSLVYPFSNHEISSEILFTEVLGQSGVGRSFGYSGPLWAYGYYGYASVFIFYMLLSASLSYLRIGRNIYVDILGVSIIFLLFRFFRQEWVIPIKTLLWVYFYPSLILIFLSSLRINTTVPRSANSKEQK